MESSGFPVKSDSALGCRNAMHSSITDLFFVDPSYTQEVTKHPQCSSCREDGDGIKHRINQRSPIIAEE